MNQYCRASKNKICIVGAGTAGLCSARHAIAHGMEPTIFEQSSNIGGTWVYTDEIGRNSYGLDIHSSMYQGLKTNLPKEIMGYPDFDVPASSKSYVPAQHILDFLKSYASNFNIDKYVKYLNHVVRIRPMNGVWQVIVKDLMREVLEVNYFEFIMICNGHYSTPFIPKITGSHLFKGKIIHSHDYRNSRAFKGESVLVIGAGPSGMDIAHEISKFAKKVTISHHLPEKPKTTFLSNVDQKPDVKEIFEFGAIFKDETTEIYSVILYCTGYKYAFPFLSMDCGIHVDNNFVQPLYKHCLNIVHPKMALIGLPFYVCASQMMDIQARFVLKYFSGEKKLPNTNEMISDTSIQMQNRWQRGYKKSQAHMMGPDQINYYTDLSITAGIQNIKPVMTKLHNESSERFLDDLIRFRSDIFKLLDDDTFIKIN